MHCYSPTNLRTFVYLFIHILNHPTALNQQDYMSCDRGFPDAAKPHMDITCSDLLHARGLASPNSL